MSLRVGVVIRTKNCATYLAQAIESVLNQSYPVESIALVDDASTDATLSIAKGFGSRVRILQQTRPGLGGAAEEGIQALTTDLIAFQDADDIWTPDRLARMTELLEQQPAWHGVMGRIKNFVSEDTPAEIAERFIVPLDTQPGVGLPSLLARRSIFKIVGPFTADLGAGYCLEWMDRARAAGVHIQPVDVLSLLRRLHASNTTRDASVKGDYLRALHRVIARRKEQTPQQ